MRIKQVVPCFRGLHVVLFKELGVCQETKRNDADTGPMVLRVTKTCGDRVGIFRTILLEDVFLNTGRIGVGRAA